MLANFFLQAVLVIICYSLLTRQSTNRSKKPFKKHLFSSWYLGKNRGRIADKEISVTVALLNVCYNVQYQAHSLHEASGESD